jgi:hypothetical protein
MDVAVISLNVISDLVTSSISPSSKALSTSEKFTLMSWPIINTRICCLLCFISIAAGALYIEPSSTVMSFLTLPIELSLP